MPGRKVTRPCKRCKRYYSTRNHSQQFCGRKCSSSFRSETLPIRFWQKVDKTQDCWVWMGRRDEFGYGRVSHIPSGAHQLSWEIHNGRIPDGLYVLHHCDNRACVRPDHLFIGTQYDNVHDMINKGRRFVGKGAQKLTEHQVKEIRARYAAGGVSYNTLKTLYGVTKTQIGRIVRGECWANTAP